MRSATVPLACLIFIGCGEAERPRFTPADPSASPSPSREPAQASREAVVPRNIESH